MSDGISVTETQPRALTLSTKPWGYWRAPWNHWKKIARAIGVVQTRILMVCIYFVFVLPLGLIMRSSADPLHLKRPRGSNWSSHPDEEPSVDLARRQF